MLGLVEAAGTCTREHVERTLHHWVHQYQYAEVNKLFGCCGQLFTSTLPLDPSDEVDKELVEDVVGVMQESLCLPQQVEMFFCIVSCCRDGYRKWPSKKKYAGSEKPATIAPLDNKMYELCKVKSLYS